MRETWLATLTAWDDFRAHPDEVIDHGDRVLVINSISGRGKGSGADVSAVTATLFTVEARQGRAPRAPLEHRAGARGAAGRD